MSTDLRDYCPTIYGPVRSRRHGLSLGINLGDARAKACTWSCIYCQCGFGHRVDEIKGLNIPAPEEVLEGLKSALSRHQDLDSVTIAGNSEPSAHPQFGQIVQAVLDLRSTLKGRWTFNVLSNGSELQRDEVVRACDLLDEIWVKLDCAEEELFRRLNRPLAQLGGVPAHLERIRRLKQPRIQTLLWEAPGRPNLANWTKANRDALLAAYGSVQALQVFVTTVKRQPAMEGLLPVPPEELKAFGEQLKAAGFDVQVFAD